MRHRARFEKIMDTIAESAYGIHDISRTELDSDNGLPRFNMPLELGVFLGCKRYGGRKQRLKCCLVLDREKYRYQKFVSDIAGQDVRSHDANPRVAVSQVRNSCERSPGAAIYLARRAFGIGSAFS